MGVQFETGGIKKELYDHRYEEVIDKPYNERIKVKPNILLVLIISFIPNVIALIQWLDNNMSDIMLFFVIYFNVMTSLMMTSMFKEAKINKRFYVYTICMSGFILFITVMLWVISMDKFDISGSGFFVLCTMFITVIVIFGIYIVIRRQIIKKQKETDYQQKIWAVCVFYRSEIVDRFVSNQLYDKLNRSNSVTYGSEQVELYTPVFKFNINGVDYLTSPNFQRSDKPWILGQPYEIYVNMDDYDECRI